jgi:glutaredoxin
MLARGEMSGNLNSMLLYIKRGCPWCIAAESWLQRQGIPYKVVDVISDSFSFAEMKKISGQSKAPVLVTPEGYILSDFGPEELPDFFKRSAIKLPIKN